MSVTQQSPLSVESLYALDDPADQGLTFFLDAMHFPYAVSPMFQSVHGHGFSAGITQAATELNAPVKTVHHRVRNNFQFERFVPREAKSEEEARQMGELAEATFKPEIARLRERWEQEHLPRILEIQARLRTLIDSAPADAATPENVDEIQRLLAELWTIHFRIALPMLLAMQLFDEFFAELFGPDADSHALVAGLPTSSMKTGAALSDLARTAQSLNLAPVILETSPEAIMDRLNETNAGREFLAQLSAFHEQYGLRQDLFDFITPTWQENPAIALANVRNYLENGRDIGAEHEQKARRAEEAIARAREQLASYPEPVRDQFDAMLQFARNAAFLQEEHNFYIDQQSMALIRLSFLRMAQHLTEAGRLDQPEDVFMLHIDELRGVLEGDNADLCVIVQERRKSFEASQQMIPPPFIGAPPEGPPPGNNPMLRALGQFFGGPPQESGDPNLIKGTPGSRGTATGVALVARTLEEATAIKPGQILVTVTTMPPWTPLFGIAAAVVAETGGPLSHCAIVAREYGVPAVVGAHGATQRIESGQSITVNGTTGMVTLHD